MKPQDFLKHIRQDQIVSAIQSAEKQTSGEIRVFISRKPISDAVASAQTHFARMGMEKTRERNGVLIFLAPSSHKFAVIGDAGVHSKCGQNFWTALTNEMSGHFRRSDFTAGIIHGVQKAGELLAKHFPHRKNDSNELSDEVETD